VKGRNTEATQFAGIGGNHSPSARTVEWLTPKETIDELGGWKSFAIDPCAPIVQPWPTARRTHTILDDGLAQDWVGRAFVNPPYTDGVVEMWLEKMADHNFGIALIFARTDTIAFKRFVRQRASALLFTSGRMFFRVGEPYSVVKTRKTYMLGDRASGNAGAPTVLCAYGQEDADVLAACEIDGLFVPLRFRRSVFLSLVAQVGAEDPTWREALARFYDGRDDPVRLNDLYAAFATHPKARTNPNYKAKLRQQLQHGGYDRVGVGLWRKAS
jgi:hypothetical protein